MKVYTVFIKAEAYASYEIEANSPEEAEKIYLALEDVGVIHPYMDLQDSFNWDIEAVREEKYSCCPIRYEEAKEYIEA